MNMVLSNLFKHNVHFCLVGHDGDQYEPYLYSKGYHYVSNDIENGESVGITAVADLYLNKLKPLFVHILSTMMLEIKAEIDCASIKVHLIRGEDHEDYDIVEYEFHPTPVFSVEEHQASIYSFPSNLLNEKFSIYVESYTYMVPERIREMRKRIEEEMDDDVLVPITPPDETFRQDLCIVCLESAPNILYLDCMHIAVCNVCNNMKRTAALRLKCDVCRATISRRIRI